MRVVIGFDDRQVAISLPAECAGIAAELMARGQVIESDYYGGTVGYKWKPADCKKLQIQFVDDAEIQGQTEREKALVQQKGEADSRYYAEVTKRAALEKDLAAVKDQLALLSSLTTCTTAPPAESESVAESD